MELKKTLRTILHYINLIYQCKCQHKVSCPLQRATSSTCSIDPNEVKFEMQVIKMIRLTVIKKISNAGAFIHITHLIHLKIINNSKRMKLVNKNAIFSTRSFVQGSTAHPILVKHLTLSHCHPETARNTFPVSEDLIHLIGINIRETAAHSYCHPETDRKSIPLQST